jgi:hypothetical protein
MNKMLTFSRSHAGAWEREIFKVKRLQEILAKKFIRATFSKTSSVYHKLMFNQKKLTRLLRAKKNLTGFFNLSGLKLVTLANQAIFGKNRISKLV